MDALERLLERIKPIAEAAGMVAVMVGTIRWVETNDPDAGYGYIDDGRLLKIYPAGVPSRLILVIEYQDGLRLYRHRSQDLTSEFKGRKVTEEWVVGFISANEGLAREIVAEVASSSREQPIQKPPAPFTQSEIEGLRAQRSVVSCSCGGMAENCNRCFGRGSYVVDGLGNAV